MQVTGLLLPLVDDALRQRVGACALTVTLAAQRCRVVLALPAAPSVVALERARTLLLDLYGEAAPLHVDGAADMRVEMSWPHGRD